MKNEWNHLGPNDIATNPDPFEGGIIDKANVDGKWFVIANNDDIPSAEEFDTKADAMTYLEQQVAILRGETVELPTYSLTGDGIRNVKRLLKEYFKEHGVPDNAAAISDPRLRDLAERFDAEFSEVVEEFDHSTAFKR